MDDDDDDISDEAVGSLHRFGALPVIISTPHPSEDAELEIYKTNLLRRFKDLRYEN